MKRKWLVLVVALAALAAWRTLLFVDEAEFVIVTQFGRPVETLREAGLHLKLPYQSAIRIDKRLQIYDPRPSEFLTSEKKNVDLDVFVCWRVEEPLAFLENVTNAAGAEARLHDIIWSELAAEVGRRTLDAIVSVEPDAHSLDELVDAVTDASPSASGSYGIRVVDVSLKRIALPQQVRDSVFQRMRAERTRIAHRYRAEGEEEALKIRAEADKQRTVLLAQAYAEAETTRGAAEAEAIKTYAAAHQKDPAFYELLRTLEAYRKILDSKTTILLSTDSDLLKYLMHGADPAKANEEK